MTDSERIAALIEKLEAHGACSWAALMDDAAAQLRADHPAQGERTPAEQGERSQTPREAAVEIVDRRHGYTVEFAPTPEAHRAEYDAEELAIKEKQGGGGATAAASRPSFEAQAEAVERALDEARSDVATFDQDDTQSDEIAALSAAAATCGRAGGGGGTPEPS